MEMQARYMGPTAPTGAQRLRGPGGLVLPAGEWVDVETSAWICTAVEAGLVEIRLAELPRAEAAGPVPVDPLLVGMDPGSDEIVDPEPASKARRVRRAGRSR